MIQGAGRPRNDADVTAPARAASAGGAEPVLALAETLLGQDRPDDALILCEHILAADAENGEAHRIASHALGLKGLRDESFAHLMKARAILGDTPPLQEAMRALAIAGIARFNEHLQAGDFEAAANASYEVAALFPHNQAFVSTAVTLSRQQGHWDQLEKWAQAMLRLDPSHRTSLLAMGELCRARADLASEGDYRARFALLPQDDSHSMVCLHNIYDGISAILCGDLDDARVRLVDGLIAAERRVAKAVPDPSLDNMEAWERYYRAAIQGIDIEATWSPTPPAAPWPSIAFADSSGRPIDIRDARNAADRQSAQAILFVAADDVYVRRFGRLFVNSVFKSGDVPCLVILHVIGAAGHLQDTAAALAIDDPRLIYSADGFDKTTVRGRSYTTPTTQQPHGLAAHYQCARFIWLGYLLESFTQPIIVCDIDSLLQRGIEDLLDQHATADLVFHQVPNVQTASRLVGNLLLARPTAPAKLFARFLRSFLEKALQAHEIDRFVDQVGLLLARHHVAKFGAPRLAVFDKTDVNNAMYKTYQDNPYRFFSLYGGFDLSSLAGTPFEVAPLTAQQMPVSGEPIAG
jgi:hypothetical protein